ncbi:MAG TPA: DUF4332 domain-containing protein [Alphaproteobacteria bacterium]|nr:DUF4332 domain-containing protein [Alphaproteobacteria bacterium]
MINNQENQMRKNTPGKNTSLLIIALMFILTLVIVSAVHALDNETNSTDNTTGTINEDGTGRILVNSNDDSDSDLDDTSSGEDSSSITSSPSDEVKYDDTPRTFAPYSTDPQSTSPWIVYVSPVNNEEDISRYEKIVIIFSEDMNPSTIDENSIVVMQRLTPDENMEDMNDSDNDTSNIYREKNIEGTVEYSGRTATFTPDVPFSPDQEFGNVFTVTVTSGAQDLDGNSISQEYMWSFTTGEDSFNAGATTAQLDQDIPPAGSTGTTTQPPVEATPEAPITQPQTEPTTTAFPWAWVVGGLLLLLMALLLFALPLSRSTRRDTTRRTNTANTFGDVYPVSDIDGIGPAHTRSLAGMGIRNTKQLWEADTTKVARQTGASFNSVRSWQHMSELASVRGVGPRYADLLEKSGIHSVAQLQEYDADELHNIVRKKQNIAKVNIEEPPAHATVENWISEARDHRFSTTEGEIA